ncbi:hypothetical protein EBB07_32860 [Paenibacillaceae bacterium]|nr:hypothetical protein EBB07_32860 [Paenibacillaceae bacterium]
MLNRIATGLHDRIIASGAQAPSIPVIQYALHILFNTFSTAAAALLIGALTGKFVDTLIVLLMFSMIRYLSGGFHLKSGVWCTIVSTCVLVVIPHIPVSSTVVYVLTGLSFIAMLWFAPANYDKYARIPVRYYPVLKALSAAVVAINFLVVSELLAITYIIQAVLLPFGGEKKT